MEFGTFEEEAFSMQDASFGLKVLIEPQQQTSQIDIVAVHGIGANPSGMWIGKREYLQDGKKITKTTNWLTDATMLPKLAPNARIMRYGYKSQWFGTENVETKKTYVFDVANALLTTLTELRRNDASRPLIFIAHSFGGIVLIKALRLAFDANPRQLAQFSPIAGHTIVGNSAIFSSTAGLVFFGTPFRGRAGHKLEEWIERLKLSPTTKYHEAGETRQSPKIWPETMSTSVPGNPYLRDMVLQFGETRRGDYPIPLWCFYEEEPSPVGKLVGDESWGNYYLVPEDTATLDVSKNTFSHGLPRHHYNLPKFPDANDEAWQTVRAKIEPLITGARQFLEERSTIKHKLNSSEDMKILDWLTLVDYGLQQSDYIRRREQGTGQWLLDSPEFKTWINTKNQTLFCPGIPGSGKTILTSIIVEELSLRFSTDTSIGIAYLYFNFRRHDEQKIDNLLASLLKQLAENQPSLPVAVKELYDQHKKKRTRPSFEDIFNCLKIVTKLYSRVFILVDALDESTVSDGCRQRFLSSLFNLQAEFGASFFATSRLILSIEKEFEGHSKLDIRASDEDVRRYLDGHMFRLPRFVTRSFELEEEIKIAIVKATEGMFLLAQLHLESFIGKRSPKVVRTVIKNLATGSRAYDHAYEHAMERISDQVEDQKELAKQVLLWISCAKRPLTTSELQQALAVEIQETELDEENLPDVEDMVSVCAGLVTVDEESRIIRLVHYTTQQYFERTKNRWFPAAEANVTTTCVTYLSFNTFGSGICRNDEEFEHRLQVHKLYSYAAQNWGHHAREASISCQGVIEFLQKEGQGEASSQALMCVHRSSWGSGYSQIFPKKMRGLHLAAYFGVMVVIQPMLKEGADLKATNSKGETPLYLSAKNGHRDVMEILLSKGADVNAQGGDDGNALYAASSRGYEKIVKILLNNGADVNARGGYDGNALQVASSGGYEKIVEMLLSKGADVNAEGGYYGNALYAASSRGYEKIVEMLLSKDADVDAEGGRYGNALYAASSEGHEKIVEILLSKGADINAQGGDDGNALYAASSRGYEKIVEMLLNNSADVNTQGEPYGKTLCVASLGGHKKIVEMLLSKGADVNAQEGYYDNALYAASFRGYEKIVEMLLSKGVDVNAEGGPYGNALCAASLRGYETIVEMLLNNSADVNARGGYDGNALYVASSRGYETIVEMLLSKGADINAQGGDDGNALQVASSRGYEKIVEILLSKGADVNAQGGRYGNALQVASSKGYKKIVEMLLSKDADVNAQGGRYGNALYAASSRGYEKIVEILLNNGADEATENLSEDVAVAAILTSAATATPHT